MWWNRQPYLRFSPDREQSQAIDPKEIQEQSCLEHNQHRSTNIGKGGDNWVTDQQPNGCGPRQHWPSSPFQSWTRCESMGGFRQRFWCELTLNIITLPVRWRSDLNVTKWSTPCANITTLARENCAWTGWMQRNNNVFLDDKAELA